MLGFDSEEDYAAAGVVIMAVLTCGLLFGEPTVQWSSVLWTWGIFAGGCMIVGPKKTLAVVGVLGMVIAILVVVFGLISALTKKDEKK
jgi:heme O synthase-like polyprenyltransferase